MKKIGESAAKFAARSYWWLIFTLVPLYFDDMYFNISAAKLNIFVVCALIVLAIMFAAFIMICDRTLAPRRNVSLYSFLALGAVAIISSACSENPRLTFWGLEGWGVGAFTIMCFALFLCLMARSLDYNAELWLPVMVISGVVLYIGVLNCFCVDVFKMRERILITQYFRYISTIGNENWYNGYLSMLVPLFCMLYLSCRSAFARVGYLVYLTLAFFNVILASSDGLVIGLGFAMLFALPYIMFSSDRLRRGCELITLYGLLILPASLMLQFIPKRKTRSGIILKMLDWRVGAALIAVGLAVWLILTLRKITFSRKTSLILTAFCETAVIVLILYFIIDTAANFSDGWGSSRGEIWRRSAEIFRDLPPLKKLIGVGPGGLRKYYSGALGGTTLLASHSEPMQYLLTTGAAGLALWLAGWGGVMASYFRLKLWRGRQIACFLPIAAYLGQSLVNSPTVTNIAMLCAITAVHISTRPEKALPDERTSSAIVSKRNK